MREMELTTLLTEVQDI